MAIEAYLTEEEAVMPGGRSGGDIAAQVLLNDMVGLFCLAIRLRMVSRAVQQVSTKVRKQVLPKKLKNWKSRSEVMHWGMTKIWKTWCKNGSDT